MSRPAAYFTIALSLSILVSRGFGQTPNLATPMSSFEHRASFDTLTQSVARDSLRLSREEDQPPTIKSGAGYESTKSAGLAVLFSALLPGAGQIYNESYWKAPVIWGLGGYFAYEWIDLNNIYKDFRDQYGQSLETAPNSISTRDLQRLRDFYRDERDKFAWYMGALYFVNLLDAFVGANLYDFNVSSDLSAGGVPVPRITATVHFPL